MSDSANQAAKELARLARKEAAEKYASLAEKESEPRDSLLGFFFDAANGGG